MEIPKQLKDEIWDYCRANDISNIDEFIIKILRSGFTSEKFGSSPVPVKIIEKEIEKIVEVTVEKEIEKIVEVPVEKIVVKEIYVTDDEANKVLNDKISKLEDDKIKLQNAFNTQVKIVFVVSDERNSLQKELEETKTLLETEKIKNKKDMYGE